MSDENEDRFDSFLRAAAADYNRPPARVPRDEMWAAIQAARGQGSALGTRHSALGQAVSPVAPAESREHPPVLGGHPAESRFRRPWLRTAVALAATLVIGITLGRISTTTGPTDAPPSLAEAGPRDSATPLGAPGAEAGTTVAAGADRAGGVRPDEPGSAAQRSPMGRSFEPDRSPRPGAPSGDNSAAYHVATLQYLTQAEALLTSFRGDARSVEMDAQMAKWSKDLLSSTRLLLDSPAASDPTRRRLLEDLEMVLVQIVRLSPRASTEERDLIDENLKDADVLGRLRTAIPAGGVSSSGT